MSAAALVRGGRAPEVVLCWLLSSAAFSDAAIGFPPARGGPVLPKPLPLTQRTAWPRLCLWLWLLVPATRPTSRTASASARNDAARSPFPSLSMLAMPAMERLSSQSTALGARLSMLCAGRGAQLVCRASIKNEVDRDSRLTSMGQASSFIQVASSAQCGKVSVFPTNSEQ